MILDSTRRAVPLCMVLALTHFSTYIAYAASSDPPVGEDPATTPSPSDSQSTENTPLEPATVSLGAVGTWALPTPWALAADVRVDLSQHPAPPSEEGEEPRARAGTSHVFRHPSGATATVLALPKSQALSLKRVSEKMAPGYTSRELEQHGQYWWWHTIGQAGDDLAIYATGTGGKSLFVAVSGVSTLPEGDVEALLAGLVLNREIKRIDEAWITFDFPSDVFYVHQDASPFSWTRGDGILAVDVTFDKDQDPEHPYTTTQSLEDLQTQLPDWTLIQDTVTLKLKGAQALEQASAELTAAQTGEPPKDAMKALIAAPGSMPNNLGISFFRRNGILKVELRAEGDDAPLFARNDLIPIATTIVLKDRYDWWADSRKMKHKVNPELATEELEEAMPALIALADLTVQGIESGWNVPMNNGLTALQQLPIVGFSLFEVGRARTPTEDSTVVNFGYLPQCQFVLRDYFNQKGDNFGSTVQGIGASITGGTRFFRQRGEAHANWTFYWPQEGTPLANEDGLLHPYDFNLSDSYPIQAGNFVPMWIKMRAGYALDPTTWLLPHRFGAFGDWHLGVGLGTNIDISTASYVDPNGEDQLLLMYNTAFTPTLGFHARLFWGVLNLSAQGFWVPPQLGIINIVRDSAVKSQVEQMLENGQIPNITELFKQSGISGLYAATVGSARYNGARGFYATAILSFPFGAPGGDIHTPVKFGIAKDAGSMPPLGAKRNRFTAITSMGLGITVFAEETSYMPFTTAWNPDGEQTPFSTINKGILIGFGTMGTNLPSFLSGPR